MTKNPKKGGRLVKYRQRAGISRKRQLRRKDGLVCLLITPEFRRGDPEPVGASYLDWHAWADAQRHQQAKTSHDATFSSAVHPRAAKRDH